MNEKIIIIRPFAYVRVFDDGGQEVTISINHKTYEAKRLFWRIYWIGLP